MRDFDTYDYNDNIDDRDANIQDNPLVDKNGNTIYNEIIEQGSRLDIVIGLPASGKSSAIVDKISLEHHSMLIDNDEAKRQFPEFYQGWGADVVHKESKEVEKIVFLKALKQRKNIVLPEVGSNPEKLMFYVKNPIDNGYSINIHFVVLDRNKAIGRMLERFIHTGRYLSPNLIDKYANERDGNKIADCYEILKSNYSNVISGFSKWDNDVGKGENPILLEAVNLGNEIFIKSARRKGDMQNGRNENQYGSFITRSEDELCVERGDRRDR